MEWMLMPVRRYADFSGRSRRKEYWMFFLGVFIVSIVFSVLFMATIGSVSGFESGRAMNGPSSILGLIFLVFVLALIVPSIAVQVRRFHDQDKSGWFVLLSLIPYVGGLIVLVFMLLEGTSGTNRYGSDPKAA
jgi:uncharacterized membrane protein YhaH (DUF805 family)